MKATLEIKCENAAFADDAALEVIRLLRHVISRLEEDGTWEGQRIALRDANGNPVGDFRFTR
jgi:hypothetical protein